MSPVSVVMVAGPLEIVPFASKVTVPKAARLACRSSVPSITLISIFPSVAVISFSTDKASCAMITILSVTVMALLKEAVVASMRISFALTVPSKVALSASTQRMFPAWTDFSKVVFPEETTIRSLAAETSSLKLA